MWGWQFLFRISGLDDVLELLFSMTVKLPQMQFRFDSSSIQQGGAAQGCRLLCNVSDYLDGVGCMITHILNMCFLRMSLILYRLRVF